MKEATGDGYSAISCFGGCSPPRASRRSNRISTSEVLQKVTETPEWKKYITDNGLKAAFLTGPDFVKWVGGAGRET